VHPKNKGFENPFPNQPNPLQKGKNPTQQYTHTPFSRFVRVTSKNIGENWGFGEFQDCEKMGRKRAIGVMGVMGWALVMIGGGVVT
jgi:hypothetical protein